MDNKGIVFQIQHFCTDDGPGIRTTVFLKGCHLKCSWCHNPEGKQKTPNIAMDFTKCVHCGVCVDLCTEGCHQIQENQHVFSTNNCIMCGKCIEACPVKAISVCGKSMSVDEVMDIVMHDFMFYKPVRKGASQGGVTLSGGELLLQPEFARSILQKAREMGVHTCIETSGAVDFDTLKSVAECSELILYDIKETDSVNHKKYIGIGNEIVLDNLRKLALVHDNITLRCPIIPDVNDRLDHLDTIAMLFNELDSVKNIELLPYHQLGNGKQQRYGLDLEFSQFDVPNSDRVAKWNDYIKHKLTR